MIYEKISSRIPHAFTIYYDLIKRMFLLYRIKPNDKKTNKKIKRKLTKQHIYKESCTQNVLKNLPNIIQIKI